MLSEHRFAAHQSAAVHKTSDAVAAEIAATSSEGRARTKDGATPPLGSAVVALAAFRQMQRSDETYLRQGTSIDTRFR